MGNKEFERAQKNERRVLENLAANANSRAFKALFEHLDSEIEKGRDALEQPDIFPGEYQRLRGSIIAYRELKETIQSAKEVVEALNADTPE